MAAPTATARQTPYGRFFRNGYRTLIAFSRAPAIGFWEKDVTPPAVNGGNPIDITSMHNDTVLTKAAPSLYDVGASKVNAAWDPRLYSSILDLINRDDGTVTWIFPDGTTYAAWGYLQDFVPKNMRNGEEPEAELTVVVTNWDPTNWTEAIPVLTEVTGT